MMWVVNGEVVDLSLEESREFWLANWRAIDAAESAVRLHDWLKVNCGPTDDWPVSIVADDTEVAERCAELLTDLQVKVEEYRQHA